MRRFTLFASIALACSGGMAQAADRHVDIVNKTGMTMTKFYASNTGADSWQEDILGRDTLDDGDTIAVNIDDGTGACKFDFKAEFENGRSLVRRSIDVCQLSSFTYNP
jgi:hypothetical protein